MAGRSSRVARRSVIDEPGKFSFANVSVTSTPSHFGRKRIGCRPPSLPADRSRTVRGLPMRSEDSDRDGAARRRSNSLCLEPGFVDQRG